MSKTLNRTKKVAFCGILSALSVVIMLTAYFPYLTYAVPAFAGALTVLAVAQFGAGWGFLTYLATAVLSVFICEKEAMVVYCCFFGYYPVIKYLLERLNKPIIEYILKFALLNAAAVADYFISIYLLGIPSENFTSGIKFAIPLLLALANIMFLIYDLALNRVIALYFNKYHKRIQKIFK